MRVPWAVAVYQRKHPFKRHPIRGAERGRHTMIASTPTRRVAPRPLANTAIPCFDTTCPCCHNVLCDTPQLHAPPPQESPLCALPDDCLEALARACAAGLCRPSISKLRPPPLSVHPQTAPTALKRGPPRPLSAQIFLPLRVSRIKSTGWLRVRRCGEAHIR